MSADDRYRAMELLAPICSAPDFRVVVVDGEPASKARPRVGKGGRVFTPASTRTAEEALAYQLLRLPTFTGNVAVACLFYRSNRQRIDLDNLTKLVLDASTKGRMWNDDSQVTALLAVLELDTGRPRTVIAYAPHVGSLTRGADALVECEACGKRFMPAGKNRATARWCSRACRTRLADPIACAGCGKPFRRRTGNQRFCSNACRGSGRTVDAAIARARQKRCANGHELTPENTYVLPNGARRCRTCQAEAARIYRSQTR